MKRQIILTTLLISIFISIKAQTDNVKTFSNGAIDKGNDLQFVCPRPKPAIILLILKNGLNIQATMDKWFPLNQEESLTMSHAWKLPQRSCRALAKFINKNENEINVDQRLLFTKQ